MNGKLQLDILDMLAGEWKLETDGSDTSGNGLNGTPSGSPSFLSGKVGSSAEFNGSNKVLVPNNEIFDHGSDDFAFNVWIYPTDVSYYKSICGQATASGSVATSAANLVLAAGAPVLSACFASGEVQSVSPTALTINNWYNIHGQRKGLNLDIYVDGVLKNSSSVSGAVNTSSGSFGIGAQGDYASLLFIGKIDQLRFYKKSFTDEEINGFYNGGAGR